MATTAKAAQGDAKVFRAADGRWYAFVELPPGPDGKRRRKKVSGKARGEVVLKRDTVRSQLALGQSPADDRLTVAQAVERWLDSRKKVAPATLANYRTMASGHIIPTAVGRKPLSVLKAEDVEALLDSKAETLSPRSVKLIRTILGAAVGQAEQRGEVARNVVRFTEGPKLGQSKHRAMTELQRDVVLVAAAGTRYEAAFRIMLTLGLRPGECLGLSWPDVDFDAMTLTVRHGLKRDGTIGDVKNDGSRRQLPLPASVVPSLRARDIAQKTDQLAAGEYWQNDASLIFTTPTGRPVSDRNLANRDFAAICTEAEVGKWDLHECRHTAATIMLLHKVPIEVVAKILGHRSIRQTADTYAHLLPRQLEDAVAAIDQGLLEKTAGPV